MTCSHTDVCQRFEKKRELYRPAGEPIDTSKYGVELISETRAREFITANHYAGSHSYPSTSMRVGLYRWTGVEKQLVGAMVFGTGQQDAAIAKWTPGLTKEKGAVLQRLVLLHDVPANGETWFLRGAFEALRSELPDVRVVISYSDPVPRVNEQGIQYKPGHIGTIYKAHNGCYLGMTARDDVYILPNGETFSNRSLSKLRNSESRMDGVEAALLELGAPPRRPGESDRAYAYRLVGEVPPAGRADRRASRKTGEPEFLRRRRRPGNHVYAWPVVESRSVRQELIGIWNPKPYPTEPCRDFVIGPAHLERSAA